MTYDSLNKKTKKELYDICENLKLTSYKSKLKPDIVSMIMNHINESTHIENNDDDILEAVEIYDDEVVEFIESNESKESNESIEIDQLIGHFENIVIEKPSKENILKMEPENDIINKLYEKLHRANMRALNLQFKYRSQFPIASYNNLQELKRRINIYNV